MFVQCIFNIYYFSKSIFVNQTDTYEKRYLAGANKYILLLYIRKMSRKSVRNARRVRRARRSMRGGDGWQHTVSVYGGQDEQHALPGTGNLIAAKQAGGVLAPLEFSVLGSESNVIIPTVTTPGPITTSLPTSTPTLVGGAPVVVEKGGNGLTQVAVPAVLLVANQLRNTSTPRVSNSKRFRRSKKSRKFRGRR